jgi:hypothetical protein
VAGARYGRGIVPATRAAKTMFKYGTMPAVRTAGAVMKNVAASQFGSDVNAVKGAYNKARGRFTK